MGSVEEGYLSRVEMFFVEALCSGWTWLTVSCQSQFRPLPRALGHTVVWPWVLLLMQMSFSLNEHKIACALTLPLMGADLLS